MARPADYSTVSVYMMAENARAVIDFAQTVFDAKTLMLMERDDGSVMHGAIRIGDSVIMLSDGRPEYPPFPVWLHVYVDDVDETYRLALERGGESVQAPDEKGDGDRRGGVRDPAGNTWWIATPV